jgi:heterodisulfide reductase subunit A
LHNLTAQVKANKNIEVFTNAELSEVNGFVGNFASIIKEHKGNKVLEHTVDHGVIVLATGGKEYEPATVLGKPLIKAKQIITQKALESRLAGKSKDRAPNSVVMIQCAGSRGDDLNYCSKLCCNHAVKNALKIKAINPASQVIVLYRDMRTYGYAEEAYQAARAKGVVFIPYSMEKKPEIAKKASRVEVSFYDPILREDVLISPDLVALSVGIVPEDTATLSKVLKVPVTADQFYLEAHVKLRPVEMAVDGVYVCGLAHSPKPMAESIVQAQAAAAKASMPLVKGTVSVQPIVSHVDKEKCIGCSICANLCPYQAIQMLKVDKKPKAETVVASCKACGICASHCPTFAISMGGFTNEQIVSQIEAFGKSIEE